MNSNKGLFVQAGSLPRKFWVLNIIQILEKMAYVIVLLQMPIYLAQKDVHGGLYLSQSAKGYIFFVWVLFQRLTPFFTGGFTDKLGYRKTLFISFVIITFSYIILGIADSLIFFLSGIMILGFGSGLFLPAMQASLTNTMSKENESTGWGIYFMLLNLGVILSPAISKALKEISWNYVFFGSATIFLLNFIILSLIKIPKESILAKSNKSAVIFKDIFTGFFKPKVFTFIFLMSGFIIVYMQFYETFPNFFLDWINTTDFVNTLHLPAFMTRQTPMGIMLSYEWIWFINSGLIIIAVVPLSWLMSKYFRIHVLITGCLLASVGLFFCGISMSGWISMSGILIYTFGELITNPKFTEQINSLAPEGKKAQYMSYLNISFALGLGASAIFGGYIYNYYGEKAYLAGKYLSENLGIHNVNLTESMNIFIQKTGLDYQSAVQLLWNSYHPYLIWLPFMAFGFLSAIGLYFYSKKILTKPD